MAFQPLLFSGFTIGSSSGGGGGSPSIGGTVTGGTDTAVLFIHPGNTLAQDPTNFNYNSTTHALTITGALSASNFSGSSSGTNTGDVTLGTANGLSLSGQVLSLALSSTSTTGALSSTDWNTFNNKQDSGSYITALTGDVTATGPGSVAATLATVNGNIGSFGSSTSIPNFTVNAKGLITAAGGNVVIAPAGTLSGTTLNSSVVTSSLTSLGIQSQALNMGNNLVSAVSTPLSGTDAATKGYVDAAINGLSWKGPAQAYAISNVPLTGGASLTIDGYSVQNGDLVILSGQILASQNGEYSVSGIGTVYLLTANGLPNAVGDAWLITNGTVYADSAFLATAVVPSATFIEFAGPTAYSFSPPLSITGNVVSISQSNTSTNGYLSSTDWNTFNNKQSTVSFGTFGSSPNANGGVISGGVITLEPADATHPGGISTTTQTIAGNKTINGTFTVIGQTDATQLFVQGNSTQTTLLAQFVNSSSVNRFSLDNSGDGVFAGTISASNFSGSSSGTNTGDQTITLTGDVTGSGTGSFATTLTNSAVTGQALTGFISGPNSPVLATDSILQGLEKLQAQIVGSSSPGDLSETSFTAADNQSSPADVTSFAFANATVRSFDATVSIVRNNTYASYKLYGIQKAASWEMSSSYTGDVTGIIFSITTAGQIQYTSTSTGFTSLIKFRAITTSV